MQDIYQQRSYWKLILAVTGGIILVITLVYSNFLASRLAANEQKNAFLFKSALDYIINNPNYEENAGIQDSIVNSFPLPVIFKMEDGTLEGNNFYKDSIVTDQVFLQKKVDEFLKSGEKPLQGTGYTTEIYYFNSRLLDYIKYYPLVQIFLVGTFVALGYFLFSSSRRSEQNRVWAGMAKETAHQLGTPISAILAWLIHLRESAADNEYQLEIITELEKDVERLDLVADRFSKIGSAPELKLLDLNKEVLETAQYMQRRAPRKVSFHFPELGKPHFAMLNSHLIDWVIENIIRNALDAMDGSGKIEGLIYEDEHWHYLEISDTGKGIPPSKFKTVFQPGFSTKKRGWGLGLSLAKRIVEEYHGGKIYVKNSKINEGTTFAIQLPKAKSA